jgi:tetratricopeptide (TPR) repeat protein
MQLDPASPGPIQTYTRAEVALNDIDSAISLWRNWIASHPSDPHATEILGSLEEAKGDDVAAMDSYKKTLQVDPNDAIASNNLAYLMVENDENIDVALTLAQTARRLLPDSAETADTLGWVYFYKKNYTAARDLLESSEKTYPDNAPIHLHLGMTYSALNDKTDAIAQLKKAQALAPNGKVGKDAGAELEKLQ